MEIPAETKTLIQKRIGEIRQQYPEAQAACLPALHVAQDHLNYVSDDVLDLVAETLTLPTAFVQGVATFYTMYNQRQVGKYHLQLCTNVSCMLMGAEELLMGLEKHLGVKAGETTKDGLFTLTEVECLAACGTGPVLQVNDLYHENMDLDAAKVLIEELRGLASGNASAKPAKKAPATTDDTTDAKDSESSDSDE